jgi:hypothetical protein
MEDLTGANGGKGGERKIFYRRERRKQRRKETSVTDIRVIASGRENCRMRGNPDGVDCCVRGIWKCIEGKNLVYETAETLEQRSPYDSNE